MTPAPFTSRPATPADAPSIARIYNQGIEDRSSTFETRPRTAQDIEPSPWARRIRRAPCTRRWASGPPGRR